MKSIFYFLTIACLLTTTSCQKDFIEISPKSEGTSELRYKTDKDFSDATIGVYREFQDVYDFWWQFGDVPGEDVIQAALRLPELVRIDDFSLDVNNDILLSAWLENYQVISNANKLLAEVEDADVSVIVNKERYIGEAKFLRALAYFNLVRIFGDVPMVTGPLTTEQALETPRTSVDVVYTDLIIQDLLDAETKLPETYAADNVGRATKGAAKSLLGKVYLTIGDFVQAESKLMEVTNMGYSLLDTFEDLFDFDNEHHSEYIFDIEYIDGNIGLGSPFTRLFTVETQDVGPFKESLYQTFGIEGTEGGGRGTPNLDFIDLFEPGDLRQYRTATTGIFDNEGNWIPIPENAALHAISLKYITPVGSGGSKTNWRVIRYADVLLMLAEAMNENNKTPEALTYLNQVRTRAGLDGYTGLAQSETREKIALERRFELFLEGQRWFDLVRTGRALEVLAPLGIQSHQTIFPIPQTQIEVVNDPSILDQNPGY
ncbi:RagB/SusD domain-containing protein [Pricia antarctica]|uniref:RagB/SusD domain-containing protein n=1 Tax=Pricia antarctica TaxID=641691 RepID=A0A1G7IX48_9FLAO|nr:RagB/SusD family nutrient uptake outer membrane protein [Pricia antarctica]SDF17188.1 RagB/SusD domain-containing protein [Pricia antarctica]